MKVPTPRLASVTPVVLNKSAQSESAGIFAAITTACVLATVAFVQAGCSSEPLSSDISILVPEAGRAIVGYNDTEYVYPIQVPDTNRYVQMRTSEPLDYKPTYEDYLKWKGK